jgi:hypothetical protein
MYSRHQCFEALVHRPRNTDRKPANRLTQLALAITFIITVKLIDRLRDTWSPA